MWGNPYKLSHYGRATSLIKYERHIRGSKHLMHHLCDLKGLVLGCFCVTKECHGNILLNELFI